MSPEKRDEVLFKLYQLKSIGEKCEYLEKIIFENSPDTDNNGVLDEIIDTYNSLGCDKRK